MVFCLHHCPDILRPATPESSHSAGKPLVSTNKMLFPFSTKNLFWKKSTISLSEGEHIRGILVFVSSPAT